MTTTGQWACATTCWLTEPSSVDESAVPTRPHHQQVGLLGDAEQRLSRVSFDGLGCDGHVLAFSGLFRESSNRGGGPEARAFSVSTEGSIPNPHTFAAP